jgi:hypothetical protein
MMIWKPWIFNCWLLVLIVFSNTETFSKDNDKLTKTISKAYSTNKIKRLEIHNKYGDIILNNWDKDSVVVAITIAAFGKNEEAAERLMKRTEIQFDVVSFGVEVYTELRKSDGWLKDFWNEMSGYSQSIISKDQLTIDFQVYLPEDLDLEITNKYGDVYIPDRSGATRLDLSNGNLKAEDMAGNFNLVFRFGNADISMVHSGEVSLKSAELQMEKANRLRIQSNSSEIDLGVVKQLKINSRTDKIVIEESHNLQGQSSFTKIRMRNLSGSMDLNTNYGAIIVDHVTSGFSEVLILGKSTDMSLIFDHMAYFNARVIAKEGKFELPRNHGLKQVYTDGTEKFIKSTGGMGKLNSAPGEVNINAQGGKLKLEFAPFNASTQQ